MRLDIPAGMAIRFEPANERTVQPVAYAGSSHICGLRGRLSAAVD